MEEDMWACEDASLIVFFFLKKKRRNIRMLALKQTNTHTIRCWPLLDRKRSLTTGLVFRRGPHSAP
jgi:hypothetical protein